MASEQFPEAINTTEEKLLFIQALVKEKQNDEVCSLFSSLTENELAHILESFASEDRGKLWLCVPDNLRGEVLAELNEDARLGLLDGIEVEELSEITKGLDAQDTAEILDSLDEHVEANVIEQMDDSRREEVESVLAYDEDAVGRYMHTDTISIRDDVKLEVVQRFLRMKSSIKQDTQELMVVDAGWVFLGSSNWDARSLELNFEINLECYDSTLNADVAQIIRKKIEQAHPAARKTEGCVPLQQPLPMPGEGHSGRAHLQDPDVRTGSIHRQSDPPDTGTGQLAPRRTTFQGAGQ